MSKKVKIKDKLLHVLLLTARGYIEYQGVMFVCWAIEHASDRLYVPSNVANKHREYLLDWIHSLLGPYDTLEGWLSGEAGFVKGLPDMREYRIRFIDHLIGQLKEK